MVPNIFHFVFGMAPDFGGKPFSLVHYLAVRSALELNNPETAWFHYQYEPKGVWWDKAKPLLSLNKIEAPQSFMGQPLFHVAHKADVVRLQALKESGGVYLDLDTISARSLANLRDCSFAIGQELKPDYIPKNSRQRIKYAIRKKFGWGDASSASTGLCNAVLLSEKNSPFVNKWLDEYKTFRSKGRDKYWNEHSVIVPERLAKKYPDNITQLGPYTFHYPLYDDKGLQSMFESVADFPEAYLHHLWESFSWDRYLSQLSTEQILNKDTTYNLIARKYISQ
jgi:hypothetical protein